MYRIIEGRGTGKTGKLMLIAKDNNGIIACSNPYAMREKAHAYGLTGIDFISYDDFINGEFDHSKPMFIDEMEIFVKLFSEKLLGYTISVED